MWLANKYTRQTDEWYLTEILDGKSKVTFKTTTNDRRVNDGYNYIILLPFGDFVPKHKWNPDIDDGYTMDTGDVIFFEYPGELTAENIVQKKREIPCCEVKQFFVVEKRFNANYQIKVLG